MKKWLALLIVSCSALASPKQELSQRLTLNEGFSAQFEQVVKDADGAVISEGSGKVDISRPSLFRWETFLPDDNVIVSDGETVWYYSPFVEQVSVYTQEQAAGQTPFVLLTRNEEQDWNQYDVTQSGDVFTLKPVAADSTQGSFIIAIDDSGKVMGFDILEQDGQNTTFSFNNVKIMVPDRSLFTFKVPQGVEIDDQRN
ncbi:outer membrane lipoprotein chaperone LolA [Vibrio sp. RC27]